MQSCAYLTEKNPNRIFASEKLENSDDLVDEVANMTINDVRHQLNAVTVSYTQFKFASNTDTITHTRNRITHQKFTKISLFSPH